MTASSSLEHSIEPFYRYHPEGIPTNRVYIIDLMREVFFYGKTAEIDISFTPEEGVSLLIVSTHPSDERKIRKALGEPPVEESSVFPKTLQHTWKSLEDFNQWIATWIHGLEVNHKLPSIQSSAFSYALPIPYSAQDTSGEKQRQEMEGYLRVYLQATSVNIQPSFCFKNWIIEVVGSSEEEKMVALAQAQAMANGREASCYIKEEKNSSPSKKIIEIAPEVLEAVLEQHYLPREYEKKEQARQALFDVPSEEDYARFAYYPKVFPSNRTYITALIRHAFFKEAEVDINITFTHFGVELSVVFPPGGKQPLKEIRKFFDLKRRSNKNFNYEASIKLDVFNEIIQRVANEFSYILYSVLGDPTADPFKNANKEEIELYLCSHLGGPSMVSVSYIVPPFPAEGSEKLLEVEIKIAASLNNGNITRIKKFIDTGVFDKRLWIDDCDITVGQQLITEQGGQKRIFRISLEQLREYVRQAIFRENSYHDDLEPFQTSTIPHPSSSSTLMLERSLTSNTRDLNSFSFIEILGHFGIQSKKTMSSRLERRDLDWLGYLKRAFLQTYDPFDKYHPFQGIYQDGFMLKPNTITFLDAVLWGRADIKSLKEDSYRAPSLEQQKVGKNAYLLANAAYWFGGFVPCILLNIMRFFTEFLMKAISNSLNFLTDRLSMYAFADWKHDLGAKRFLGVMGYFLLKPLQMLAETTRLLLRTILSPIHSVKAAWEGGYKLFGFNVSGLLAVFSAVLSVSFWTALAFGIGPLFLHMGLSLAVLSHAPLLVNLSAGMVSIFQSFGVAATSAFIGAVALGNIFTLVLAGNGLRELGTYVVNEWVKKEENHGGAQDSKDSILSISGDGATDPSGPLLGYS